MKTKAVLLICMFAWTSSTQAGPIAATSLFSLDAVAGVTSATGNWRSYSGTGIDTITDFSRLSDTVSNGTTDTVVFNTFVWSEDDTHSTITLSFGAHTVVDRPGDDLAIFSVGPATIGVTIDDTTVQHSSTTVEIGGIAQGVFSSNNPPAYLDTLDVILIDLDSYSGISQFNQLTIDALTEAENPLAWPGISAAGAFNTALVPIPLPLVLFGSGLVLLGCFGRRKR